MTADWSLGEADEHAHALLAQRFDPSRLSVVIEGKDQAGTWELHDGPHPRIEDPTAVGERFILRDRNGDGAEIGSVGAALSAEQTAIVGASGAGVGRRRREFLTARCAPMVATANVEFDDGDHQDVPAITSASTGQQWIVLAVEPHHIPTSITFHDDAGNLLDAQTIAPRPHHQGPHA